MVWLDAGILVRDTSHLAAHVEQGFRYVAADAPPALPAASYETDKPLSAFLEHHYGDDYFGVPNFMRVLADLAIQAMAGKPARRALDLG